MPEDYPTIAGQPSTPVVLVETGGRPVDDERLFGLAAQEERVLGVIANLQVNEEGFAQRLAHRLGNKTFKGVRLRPIEAFDLSSPALLRSLDLLSGHDLLMELGVKSP